MRYIMHDYPDKKCHTILTNIKAAMGADSVILIDDMIIPDTGAHPHATAKDIAMMVNFVAMERTVFQWQALFGSVGLKVVSAATYNQESRESIQVLSRSDAHEYSQP